VWDVVCVIPWSQRAQSAQSLSKATAACTVDTITLARLIIATEMLGQSAALQSCQGGVQQVWLAAEWLTICAGLCMQATEFERMQWTVLNSAVSLMGYWCAAALVDKKW